MASHRLFPSILPGSKEEGRYDTEEDDGPLTTEDLAAEEPPTEEDPESSPEEGEGEEEESEGGRTLVPTESLLDEGECPWCDDYEGDAPAQHAAAAHEEEWKAYKDLREETDE